MVELQPECVQGLAADPGIASAAAIDRITNDRMPEMGEVHPDLVSPPGNEIRFDQGGIRKPLQHAVPGDRRPAAWHHRHPRPVPWMPPNGGVDSSLNSRHDPVRQRKVGAADSARRHLLLQSAERPLCLGDDEQPGGVLIQPVHDARAQPAAHCQQLRNARGNRIDQGAGSPAGPGMHGESCGLIDDQNRVIFVNDLERDVLRGQCDRCTRWNDDLNPLAAAHLRRRFRGCAVNPHLV